MLGLMRVRVPFAMALSLAGCAAFAAQQAPRQELQQFVVLRSETLTAPFDPLTSEQAHCAISGSGNFASMRCQTPAGTAKANYHYVTTLVVDQQGMAYGIACHQSLIDIWCKKFSPGIAIEGSFDGGQKSLSIADVQKFHSYQVLTSAFVGPLPAGQPVPSAKPAKTRPAPAATAAPATPVAAAPVAAAPPSNVRNAAPAADNENNAQGNASGACVPAAASCVTFVSEPQGADIYVDGKFVGNTPSTLALPAGSHEVRVEANRFKPWTRTLASTAGSTVTIHATLEKK
jgi:PEGA domain-containing protein